MHIAAAFLSGGFARSCTPLGQGRIHETWRICWQHPDGIHADYVLQRINRTVFAQPAALMGNLLLVTEFLRTRFPHVPVIRFHKTVSGESFCRDSHGEPWRLMDCIDGVSHSQCPDLHAVGQAGEAFGQFDRMLAQLSPAALKPVLPELHHTRKHLERLFSHADAGVYPAARSAADELRTLASMREEACVICDGVTKGSLPLRVMHGDAKCSNLLFDTGRRRLPAVIDLDTVRADSLLFDFGDAMRSMAYVQEGGRLRPDAARCQALREGWLRGTQDLMTAQEREYLGLSAFTVAVELAARYLDDYLTGGNYFRTVPPEGKLARVRQLLEIASSSG